MTAKSPDPYDPGPHRSDDGPPMGKPGSPHGELSLGGTASLKTWKRARARAYCPCGGLLLLDDEGTPHKQTGPSRFRIGCPCESCGALSYLTPKEMLDIGRTLAQQHSPGIVIALVNRARALGAQAHQAMEEAGPGASEHSARLSTAAATLEAIVLRAAGLQSEKVEHEHSGTVSLNLTPEDEAEINRRIDARVKRLGGEGEVIDVTPEPTK